MAVTNAEAITQENVNEFIKEVYTDPYYDNLTDEEKNQMTYDAAKQYGVSREAVVAGFQNAGIDFDSKDVTGWVTSDPNRTRLATQVSDVTDAGVGMDVQDYNAIMSGGITDENWLSAYDKALLDGMTVEQASLFSGDDWYGVDDFGKQKEREFLTYGGTPYTQEGVNSYYDQLLNDYYGGQFSEEAAPEMYDRANRYNATVDNVTKYLAAHTGESQDPAAIEDWIYNYAGSDGMLGGSNMQGVADRNSNYGVGGKLPDETLTDYYTRLSQNREGGILGQGLMTAAPTVGSQADIEEQTVRQLFPEVLGSGEDRGTVSASGVSRDVTRQQMQNFLDDPGLFGYIAPVATAIATGVNNWQANKINENGGSSTYNLNTNRGFSDDGNTYTSSYGTKTDTSGMSDATKAGLEIASSQNDVTSYED